MTRIRRSRLLAPFCAGLAAACAVQEHTPSLPAPRAGHPNVVILTVDTLRADHVGAYGSASPATPAIDALAARGTLFERAFAPLPKTNPSLSSLMTGRYPSAHGMRRNGAYLPESELTLAELLQAAGYRAAAFISNHVMHSRHGMAQGFDLYDETLTDAIPTRDSMERTARPLVDAVLAWARDNCRRGGTPAGDAGIPAPGPPLLLWVHFIDPHGPYTPPGFQSPVEESEEGEGLSLPVSASNEGRGVIPAYQALPGVTLAGEYVSRYAAEVEHTDRELGRLLGGLREVGILDGALIVFAADHGESLGDHDLWFQHGSSLYDSQIRVPLILSGPGIAPSRSAATVSLVDVLPTLLDLLGLPIHEGIQGRSLRSGPAGAVGAGLAEDRIIHAELDQTYASIRGTEKLIWDTREGKIEQYNAAADPEETRDLCAAGFPPRPDLMKAAGDFARINTRDVPTGTDEETLRVLRSLGYVDGS